MISPERSREHFSDNEDNQRDENLARIFGGVSMAGLFTRMELDDPRRPIQILKTHENEIPEGAEKFLNHNVDRVQFPNGKEGYYHRVEVPEGVMVGHINRMGELALVMNYRHALGRYSVELPSGGLDPDEAEQLKGASPEEREKIFKDAALREFREEVGVEVDVDDTKRLFGDIQKPGILRGAVGFADLSFHIFQAEGGRPVPQHHDDGEAGMMKVGRVGLDDAAEMIGFEIVDPASSVGVLKLSQEYGKSISRSARKANNHIARKSKGNLRRV